MEKYLEIVRDVLSTGSRMSNRTGIDTLYKLGLYLEFDMEDGFPLLTTKKVNWQSCFAEMLGFLRGYTNAADFRALGSKVWDANANENPVWINNPARKGPDDLGRIYGVQWRDWGAHVPSDSGNLNGYKRKDQLLKVYCDLKEDKDDRREIITAWNPGELDLMALPPCHDFMQFGLRKEKDKNTLDLFIHIRSNDIGLGMPFNIAGYAWLLHVMAKITGHKPGRLLYFAFNYHIYVSHIDALYEQCQRTPLSLPYLVLGDCCTSLSFLDHTTMPLEEWCYVDSYEHRPPIKLEMAV